MEGLLFAHVRHCSERRDINDEYSCVHVSWRVLVGCIPVDPQCTPVDEFLADTKIADRVRILRNNLTRSMLKARAGVDALKR